METENHLASENQEISSSENPFQPAPSNEQAPTTATANENQRQQGIFESAREAMSQISQRIRKGRGRPRKDGMPGKADQVEEVLSSGQPGEPAQEIKSPSENIPIPDLTSIFARGNTLLRKTISNSLGSLIKILKGSLRTKCNQAGLDKDFTDKAIDRCEPEPDAMADWTASAELVLEKYKVNTEYAPEIALAVNTCRIAAPFWMLFRELNAEIARKKKLEQPKNPAPAPAPEKNEA